MRKQKEEYAEIGYRLINEREEFKELKDADIQIAFLEDDTPKVTNGRIIFGECEKIQKKYEWCCPFDMAITIYAANTDEYNFDAHQMEVLIRHELMHIGVKYGNNGASFHTVPHDLEDFKAIINDEGTDWELRNYKQTP